MIQKPVQSGDTQSYSGLPILGCPICGGQLREIIEVPYLRLPGVCRFVGCNACETAFEANVLADKTYTGSNTDYNQSDIKFYVEYAAGIHHFARFLVLLRSISSQLTGIPAKPRYLDIGTAFGFAVAMAQHYGWEAVGVEPSSFGKAGKELLGVEILPHYLGDAGFEAESFDYISISDVIEHLAQPQEMIRTALTLLKPGGVMLLTTPNGEVLSKGLEVELADILSPGYHLTLFSPQGLRHVLEAGSAGDMRFFFQGGTSGRKAMTVLVARQTHVLPTAEPPWAELEAETHAIAEAYLEQLVAQKEQAGQDDILYYGALFRLFELRMQQQDLQSASGYQRRLAKNLAGYEWPDIYLAELAQVGFAGFVAQVPAYAGLFYYYTGLLESAHHNNHRAAAQAFAIAEKLFEIEKHTGIFPRVGWPERARYHKAAELLQSGDPRAAAAAFQALLEHGNDLDPELRAQLYNQLLTANWRAGHWLATLRNLWKMKTRKPAHSG